MRDACEFCLFCLLTLVDTQSRRFGVAMGEPIVAWNILSQPPGPQPHTHHASDDAPTRRRHTEADLPHTYTPHCCTDL